MEYKHIIHAAIRLSGSKVIYVDPFMIPDAPHDGEIVFVTHSHYDHYSPEDIKKVLHPDGAIVCGFPLAGAVAAKNGGIVKGIAFETVPAYNISKPFHKKQDGGLGYIIALDGVRIYIAGDTDLTPELCAVKCDLAFLPVGGKYTMNASEAANAAKALGCPCVPVHFGALPSVAGAEAAEEFRQLCAENRL